MFIDEPGYVLVCDIMDPKDQRFVFYFYFAYVFLIFYDFFLFSKDIYGKPLEPLEPDAWNCNVICGNGMNSVQARITTRAPTGSPRSCRKRNSVDEGSVSAHFSVFFISFFLLLLL